MTVSELEKKLVELRDAAYHMWLDDDKEEEGLYQIYRKLEQSSSEAGRLATYKAQEKKTC